MLLWITTHETNKKWREKIMLPGSICGDIICRPYTYCRRRQYMPISILFSRLLDDNICFKLWDKLSPATEYVVNIKINCRCKLYWHGNKVQDTVIVKSQKITSIYKKLTKNCLIQEIYFFYVIWVTQITYCCGLASVIVRRVVTSSI